jgi:HlyD family secretion protein
MVNAILARHPGAMSERAAPAIPSSDHRAYSRIGLVAIGMVLALLGGFGAKAPLDSAAIAPGRVATESSTKPIQHLEGGIVHEILVKESDVVKEGQVLFRLEPTQARANSGIVGKQIDADLALEARLIAERDLTDTLTFPKTLLARRAFPDTAAAIDDQERRFKERRATIDNDTKILRSRLEQITKEVGGLERQRTALRDQIENIASDIENFTVLLKQGLYTKSKLNALKREQLRLEGQLGSVEGEIARNKEIVEETNFQIRQAEQKYVNEAAKELPEVRARLTQGQERLSVAQDVMSRVEVKAPQDGIVQGIKVHAPGAVVRPGDSLAELVPTGDKLVMAARVSPLDIDTVAPKQKAEIRFPAFSTRRIPTILGRVETVAADAMLDEYTKEPYYLARVLVDSSTLPADVRERLIPGMPADVLITTGERTLLQYLVGPLSDLFAKSMREQ